MGYTHLVADDLATERLVAPFDLEIPGDFAYYVVYPKASANRRQVTAFRDWLLSQAEESWRVIANPSMRIMAGSIDPDGP